MKKILLPVICLCLFACENGITTSINAYASELSDDLKTLLISKPSYEKEHLPFSCKATITESLTKNDYFEVTCLFSYKDEVIEDIHFVVVPYSYDLSKNLTDVTNLGYESSEYTLSNTTNPIDYTFKGYKLTYLTNNDEDGVKVLFKSKKHQATLFAFANEEIVINK